MRKSRSLTVAQLMRGSTTYHKLHSDLWTHQLVPGCQELEGSIPSQNRLKRGNQIALVDPVEYRTAETRFAGVPCQIVCALEVTLQVIQDYQRLLDSNITASISSTEPLIA